MNTIRTTWRKAINRLNQTTAMRKFYNSKFMQSEIIRILSHAHWSIKAVFAVLAGFTILDLINLLLDFTAVDLFGVISNAIFLAVWTGWIYEGLKNRFANTVELAYRFSIEQNLGKDAGQELIDYANKCLKAHKIQINDL